MKLKRILPLCSALVLTVCWNGGSANAAVTEEAGSEFTWDGIDGPLMPSGVVPSNSASQAESVPVAIDSVDNPPHAVNLDSPLDATGIRIDTPGSETAIDETEVHVIPEPAGFILGISGLLVLVLLRRRK